MITLFILIFLIYTFIFLKFAFSKNKFQNHPEQKISVIVAAKNEENNLPALIDSLKNQNYSDKNFEVIIVDDNSEDNTFQIVKNLIQGLTNFRVIQAENKIYKGKRGALQIGIEKTKFDNILITDADCQPSKNWIKSFSNGFSENADFLFGVSPYFQTNSFVNKIASFDNLWVHILTFSFANIKLPYSAAARSFGFKKSSFQKIKGFNNTLETLSGDDDLLLREAVKQNLCIKNVLNQEAFVFTKTKNIFSDFLNQKSRHTSTSTYYNFNSQLLLAVWHFINTILLFSPLLFLFSSNFILMFIIKIIIDIFLIRLLMRKFGYRFSIIEIFYLQVIYDILIIVYFLNSFSKRNSW